MNKIKGYFIRQATRPGFDLAADFVIIGGLFTCIYFGWIH
tara:strand:- start:200 stop:319 length:120 start_codon:yes stop_codon:yes gene_type:complete